MTEFEEKIVESLYDFYTASMKCKVAKGPAVA